ncbi:MAG: hypothetical protein RL748_3633 [Pseudomonadota bacterium]
MAQSTNRAFRIYRSSMTPFRIIGLSSILGALGLALYFAFAPAPPLPASAPGAASTGMPLAPSQSSRTSTATAPPAPASTTLATNLATSSAATPPKQDAAVCAHLASIAGKFESEERQGQALADADAVARLRLKQTLTQISQNQTGVDQAAAHFLLAQTYKPQSDFTDAEGKPLCEKNQHCPAAEAAMAANPGWQQLNALARLALNSADPQIYALAFHACQSVGAGSKSGYCGQISAAQWVHRDPDNGSALLYLISELGTSPQAGTKAALDDALFRLSQAKKFDAGLLSLAQFQQRERDKLNDPFVQFAFMLYGQNGYTNLALPAFQNVLVSCKPEALRDANRRQVCDGIARKLLSDDAMLISHGIGKLMAHKLGWPEPKLAELDEEFYAMLEIMRELSDNNAQQASSTATGAKKIELDCQLALRGSRHMERSMELGEVALARQMLAQQTTRRAELAAKYRAHQKSQAVQKASAPVQ